MSDRTSEEQLAQQLRQLPLLPAVVMEILSLDPEADDYMNRLVRLAERDPPFAVRVLQCANSASSAPSTAIVSLGSAVLRLGTDQCAGLVLALAVIKVFIPKSEAQRLLWIHALQTALFARRFCEGIPSLRGRAEQAYLCGLLHDIGRFVQFEGAPADLGLVNDLHWTSPSELVDVERATLGYDHALLGWHACKKWSLPDSLCEVVRRHHDSLPATNFDSVDIINAVQWADALSVALITNPRLAGDSAEHLVQCLATDHAELGPGHSPEEKAQWHRWVPGLQAESMQLARELNLLR